ncbi:MAG TPA: beta-ketoacyl-ACP synthase III [Clostridia bacterium]
MNEKLAILGTGHFLPSRTIYSSELDNHFGKKTGYIEGKTGVRQRFFIKDETASFMGASALKKALDDAALSISDIDLIICASGTTEQPIPCTAALIQEQLGCHKLGIPCFDVNATCLSFVVGLDIASCLINSGRYKKIALVSTEIASVGLNWSLEESSVLFGDGAAAAIVGTSENYNGQGILGALIKTYSDCAHSTEIPGGGTRFTPHKYNSETKNEFTFKMDGRAVFKRAYQEISGFMKELLLKSGIPDLKDIDIVIPHQASKSAMDILRKKLEIPEHKWVNIISDYGNQIAASIPMALHVAKTQARIKKGDIIMLVGTSAGLSIGGIVFEY